MSSVCKVPIIEGLYSKFLSMEEQGCRVICVNAPVLLPLMYKLKGFNYDSWCIGYSGISLYGLMVSAWL
jgi:hypothetical protein